MNRFSIFHPRREHALALVLTLAIATGINAPAETPNAPDHFYAVEPLLDDLAASWPTRASDFERTLSLLQDVVSALRTEYAAPLRSSRGNKPNDWQYSVSPQRMEFRISRLESHRTPVPQPYRNQPGGGPPSPYIMPQKPGYYAFHYRTPTPGRRPFWDEFFLLSRDHLRVHATRFDEYGALREFVLVQWAGEDWRTLSYRLYPDAAPQALECWENGRPVAFRATWDLAGAASVVPLDADADLPYTVCTVSVSFEPTTTPDTARTTPPTFPHVPVAGLYLGPRDEPMVIPTTQVAHYEFAGWTGAVTSPFTRVNVLPGASSHLVAHAVWYSESNNLLHWRDSTLHHEIRRILDRPEGVISSYDLQNITALDLTDMQIKTLDEIRLLRDLRELILTGTPVEDLFPLTPYGAIQDALTLTPTVEDPGLLNRVLLALHTGVAPPLKRLVLPATPLRNEGDRAYLFDVEITMAGAIPAGPPEPLTIDLVDALTQFVTTYYPDEDPLRFDQNDYIFLAINKGKPGPNGMPDAAEFRLLQAILQSPHYDSWKDRAIPFHEGMRIWNANLALAKRLLGDIATEEPFLLHVLCAYVTAGQWDERDAAVSMINELKGLTLRPELFEVGLGRVIRPKEQIRIHARTNHEIWNSVLRGRELNRTVLDAYADAVMKQLDL